MASIRTLLLVWVEVVMASVKAILSITAVDLVIVWATDVIQWTMMRPNLYLRSSGVVLSSANRRSVSIVTRVQRVATCTHHM